MKMFGQQWDHGRFRHQGEPFGCNGGKQGWAIAVGEKCAFAGAAGLDGRRQHSGRSLRKLALSGHFRTEIGESFDRSKEAPEIVFLQWHAAGAKPEQKKSNTHSVNDLVS